MKPHYTRIPSLAIRSRKLSKNEKLVLFLLLSYGKQCWPSYETIAKDIGICRTTVATTLKSLKFKNIISIIKKKTKNGLVNQYSVNNAIWELSTYQYNSCTTLGGSTKTEGG